MNRSIVVAALAASLFTAGCGTTAAGSRASVDVRGPDVAVSVSYFYDDLAPYGRWVEYGPYGWCWVPLDVAADWRPYEDGRWALTDYGWAWVSYEPWGWATCHYGRWDYDAFYGWVWVPGTVWAPAWVAWHCGDDWVGWAPLPPGASWQVSVGLRFGDVDRIPSSRWCFVPRRHFSDTKLKTQVVSIARNPWMIERTKDSTLFEIRNGHPVNRGVPVAFVEKGSPRKIRPARLVDADSRGPRERQFKDRIAFYRPALRDDAFRSGPPSDKRGRDLALSGPELERRHERQRRQLEADLTRGRSNLRRQHERELKAIPPRDAPKVRERQTRETRSFEQQAGEERRRLEDRHRERVANAERSAAPEKGRPHRKSGSGRGRGK
jgi:hypothetical protein